MAVVSRVSCLTDIKNPSVPWLTATKIEKQDQLGLQPPWTPGFHMAIRTGLPKQASSKRSRADKAVATEECSGSERQEQEAGVGAGLWEKAGRDSSVFLSQESEGDG